MSGVSPGQSRDGPPGNLISRGLVMPENECYLRLWTCKEVILGATKKDKERYWIKSYCGKTFQLRKGRQTMSETDLSTHERSMEIREMGEFCPPRRWERDNICDVSILTYRYNLRIRDRLVECTLRYRVERCTEDYVLGDLLHSLTLLPGEEVFMSVRNRHSIARFTEDKSYSASQVARTSDRIWTETFKTLATDFQQTTSQTLTQSAHSEFKETNVGGSGGVNLFGVVKIGGGGSKVTGTFDATSSQEFFSELNQHLRSTFHQTNQVVRDTMSVSLTEINSHRETTTEVEDELKVSTRRFKNINQCHTVTHYFFQIAKRQRVRIELIDKSCRALNEFANTAVQMKPLEMSLATNHQVIANTQDTGVSPSRALISVEGQAAIAPPLMLDQIALQEAARISAAAFQENEKARAEAVANADEMVAALPNPEPFEEVTLIPTEALYVESELGSCMLCEPYVVAKHELELEHMKLQNRKLRREIELLDQYKDYRCCDAEAAGDE
jgi:hypothetical protein